MPVFEVRPLVVSGNDQDGYTVERMSDNTTDLYIRPLMLDEDGIINTMIRAQLLKRIRRPYGVVPLDEHGEEYEVVVEETQRPLFRLARYSKWETYGGWRVVWTDTIRRINKTQHMVLDFEEDPNGEEKFLTEYHLDIEILARNRTDHPDDHLVLRVGPSTHPDGLEGSQADEFEFELDAWREKAVLPCTWQAATGLFPPATDWRNAPFKFGFDPVSGEPLMFDPVQMAEACLDVELHARGLFRSGEPVIPTKLIAQLGVPCFLEQDEGACRALFDALMERGMVTDIDRSKKRRA